MSVWYATGSVGPLFQGKNSGFHFMTTGSFASWNPCEDRTGQLVRHGDQPEIYLVRESNVSDLVHTVVNERNEEQKVGEDTFHPWGAWRKVTG